MGKCVLITGGARSGKSRLAQEMAVKSNKSVLFVATATAGDDEMRRRIEEHRRQRPPGWATLEAPQQVGASIRQAGTYDLVVIDCITLLISNIFGRFDFSDEAAVDSAALEKAVREEIRELVDCTRQISSDFLIVTNEVGLGLVPPNVMGRLYRDLLGLANQMLAARADEVYITIAGLPLQLKPPSPL